MKKTLWCAASAIALTANPLTAASTGGFNPQRLSEHVKTLGSDDFQGRGVNTPAETKTVNYIIDQFRSAGLEPGGDVVEGKRTWTQAVPLLQSDIVGTPQLSLDLGNGQTLPLTQGDQIAVRSPTNGQNAVSLANTPLALRRLRSHGARAATGTTSRART